MTNGTRGRWGVSLTSRSLFTPGKTRYPLYRRMGEPQGRSGQVRKISLPPGFYPRITQRVTSLYTDWATRLTFREKVFKKSNHTFYFKLLFFPKNHAVYEARWSISRRMLFACCITKTTNTHSEYRINIAFPWQRWLGECTSVLRHTYTSCLLLSRNVIMLYCDRLKHVGGQCMHYSSMEVYKATGIYNMTLYSLW